MADERRRTTLGDAASAAVPVLWALLAEHGTQAKLAAFLGEDSGNVSRLLYGVRKPGRALSVKLASHGVAAELWDEPIPDGWLPPHATDRDSSSRELVKCESSDNLPAVKSSRGKAG